MKRFLYILIIGLIGIMMVGCHYPEQTERQYTVNYNFIVTGDSIALQVDKPLHNIETAPVTDTFFVRKGDQLVVAQIATIPEDSIDSVWVKVARDQMTMGWTHESELLPNVVPDDPISEFINMFSHTHLLYFIGIIVIAVIILLTLRMRRQRFRMVHYHDVASIYPTMLCIVLSGSALLYASIQRFIPETWVHYYYQPTLNPFGLPLIMSLFVLSVWLMVVLVVATIGELYQQLKPQQLMLYVLSLLAVLMVEYLFFSLATLATIGYLLYPLYVVWALVRYWNKFRPRYICGSCGTKIHKLGRCPKCGMYNN